MTDQLDSQLQALHLIEGVIHQDILVAEHIKTHSGCTTTTAQSIIEEKMLAIITIEGTLDYKYGPLKHNLANQMITGIDKYPDTRPKAQTLLTKFIAEKPKKPKRIKLSLEKETMTVVLVAVTEGLEPEPMKKMTQIK